MNQQEARRRLEALEADARHRGRSRYSDAEWAVMEARLTAGERAEYAAFCRVATMDDLRDDEVERAAELAEKLKGIR